MVCTRFSVKTALAPAELHTMGLFGAFRKPDVRDAVPSPQGGAAAGADAPSRRQAERFETAVLTCRLGDVKDLSGSGMRVVSRQLPPVPPGVLFEFDLEGPSNIITLIGRIVRVRKVRGTGFEIGVDFQRLTPEVRAALESLARFGVVKGRKPGAGGRLSVRAEIPDLYALLGVAPQATADDIQRAFRDLARQHHPDLSKTPESQDRFVELHKAYDVLRDVDKRRAYDAARASAA